MKNSKKIHKLVLSVIVLLLFFPFNDFTQTKIHPTNHAYIKYFKDEVLKKVTELGYESYIKELIEEAELTEKTCLPKKVFTSNLHYLPSC